ncbi:MAG: OmpA family protein [Gammaproteobacteria bacterium]|nr:OmpA family protein [Gammaproteobacteria bacterium]
MAVVLTVASWAGSAVILPDPAMARDRVPPLHTVLFDFGEDRPSGAQLRALQRLAGDLEPGRCLVITGYTDNIGPRAYNDALAFRRAKGVADHLVETGIDGRLFRVEGRGCQNYLAGNEHREGRALNRRVEIRYAGRDPEGGLPG